MNYKELWEQARALAFEEPVDMDGPLEGIKGFNQQVYEKFGELIVKECATTCDNIGKEARKEWKANYIPHDDGRSDGAWECKAAILEHFGVEE